MKTDRVPTRVSIGDIESCLLLFVVLLTVESLVILVRFLNKLSSLQWEENTTKQEMIDEQKIRRSIKKEYDDR